MGAHLPKVTIVVPTYNAERTIGPLLDSLLKLDYPDYEVVVVNDGSRDRTKALVEQYPVRIIDQPNRGASAARDAGLRAASGEIVAYVDSDVTVEPDWLRKLVAPFADSSLVGGTTGRTVFLRNETCSSWMRSLDIERRNARRKEYTRLANGPNCAFRRNLLLELGGFDPRWYHAEDTEVSYRVWQRGFRIRYVSDAVVHHVPEEDWRDFLRKRYRDAKAFTRMLFHYPKTAILEDDFVETSMKVEPPLFLLLILAAFGLPFLLWTPVGVYFLAGFLILLAIAVFLNLAGAIVLAKASRSPSFFFKGLVLGMLRGIVWGVGLGVGGVRQVLRA